MRTRFIPVANTTRYLGAIESLQRRGAGEACLVVVDGEPGLGKSHTAQWWALTTGSLLLRAKAQSTAPWLMRELLGELGVQPEHSFERMFRQAVTALSARSEAAAREGVDFAIVLDECDHVIRRREVLETMRDLSDMLEVPIVLVGMGRVRHGLTRYPQIASRVAQYVQFETLAIDDVRAMVDGLAEVPVGGDLVELIHGLSKGRSREVLEAIAAVERFGRRNPPDAGGVTAAAMAGEVLMNDRATGRPIHVRAA